MLTIKEKIKERVPLIGTHSTITSTVGTEIFSYLNYDFIWIDMEHTVLSCEQVYQHILAAKSGGSAAFVRVPVDDLTYTKRVLEMGVDGIIFPMAKDAEHVKRLLDWTLYPPLGKRGCGPKGAIRYGIDDEIDYFINGNNKICRFVQIESKLAVENAEEIARIPYLDGGILGMCDLSGSIGRTGDIFCKENIELAKKAIAAFREEGKTVGVSTTAFDAETLIRYVDMGINMISTGADFDYILKGAKKTLETMKEIRGEKLSQNPDI